MTFTRMLAVLLARKNASAAVFLLCVVVVMLVTFLLPKQYTATASVVADSRPDPITALASPSAFGLAFIATQVDVIKSDRVLFRVMRNLKLTENPTIRQQWQDETRGDGSIEVWLAELFKKRLDISPSRESNVIDVSYTAPDPRFAAGIANAVVQAYIDTSVELRVNPAKQYASFFDKRAKEARDALEVAQKKLSAFENEHGLLATDQRLDLENARLAELSTQMVQLQAISAESGSRKSQAQGAQSDRIQEVLNNPVIGSMKADLSRQESRLQELSTRLGDKHPQVQELKALIAELNSKIDAETRKVTSSVGMTNAIHLQRDAQVRGELEAQRAKVMKLKSTRDEGQVLAREVESAQRVFDAVTSRQSQSALESQSTQSNVSVLTEAVPPNDPSSPRVLLNAALAVLLGLLLAFGTALGLEALDARVRTPEDAVALLGVPLLGQMLVSAGPRADKRKGVAGLLGLKAR